MKAIELFAGAGGLALGTMAAGFRHDAVVEWDRNACDTIRENNRRGFITWPLHQADVREFDFSRFGGIDLLAGGPPCQPFSIGGKHRGYSDHRNLFPEAVRAVREIRPCAVLVENVKGLLRAAFAKYFEYVLLQLTHPELAPRQGEKWAEHLSRLRASPHEGQGSRPDLPGCVSAAKRRGLRRTTAPGAGIHSRIPWGYRCPLGVSRGDTLPGRPLLGQVGHREVPGIATGSPRVTVQPHPLMFARG